MALQNQNTDINAAYSDPKVKGLLQSVNDASASASAGWVLFISAMAYFFIALAGVTNKDFLLNTAVDQPILQVSVDLQSFFLFAPLVLVFVHFGILIQHEILSSKVRALDLALLDYEGAEGYRTHPMRRELHNYFFVQALAGPRRSKLLLFFLNTMSWTTLFLMPIITLLAFQITYLPFHDASTTGWHRLYLLADIFIFLTMGTLYSFLDSGFFRGLTLNLRYNTTNFMGTNMISVFAVFFSFCVATLPDSFLDNAMKTVWSTPVPYGWTPETPGEKPKRVAFWPTAYLFEGEIDEGKSKAKSLFSRNLIITDQDLIKDSNWNKEETTLSLRARNFSYAIFDRTDLKGTDFTRANLNGVRFYKTDLSHAKFDYAQLQNADFRGADLGGKARMLRANLDGADLRKIKVFQVDLREASLKGANLQEFGLTYQYTADRKKYKLALKFQGADFRNAKMQDINFFKSNVRGANFTKSNLTGASIRYSNIEGADFSSAEMIGANFTQSNLTGAQFKDADLRVAYLEDAILHGVDFSGAQLAGAKLGEASIWMVQPLDAKQIEFADLRKLSIAPTPDHKDSYNQILQQVELTKVRELINDRIEFLLNRSQRLSWKQTPQYLAWENLNNTYTGNAPDNTADFYSKLICTDLSKDGYAVSEYLEKAVALYKRPSSRNYGTFVPTINVQRLVDNISKDSCTGAKRIAKYARYRLGRKLYDYHRTNDDIKKWKAKQNATSSEQ